MPDFNVRADSVNVEQIMEQIRARIREKRGIDYTEQQLQELAAVKLEKFLDPKGVRSDLLDRFRQKTAAYEAPELPTYTFGEETLYETHRGALRWMRRLLQPILKLFFNPNPLIMALHVQTRINAMLRDREERRELLQQDMQQLQYEVIHNLVVEITRLGIDMKNLKMRAESLTSRLEFNERRARALESVVAYSAPADDSREREVPVPVVAERSNRDMSLVRPPPPAPPPGAPLQEVVPAEGPGQRSKRRRRRRGRRSGAGPIGTGNASQESQPDASDEASHPDDSSPEPSDPELDQRAVRPEPIEQAFGAGTHPAEPTSTDFTATPAAEGDTRTPVNSPPSGSDES